MFPTIISARSVGTRERETSKQFVRTTATVAAGLVLASLTGCASMITGTNQLVSVETLHASGPVSGAVCRLENDKGVYYLTTPGTVTVHRAYGDMIVKCDKPGFYFGITKIASSTKGMVAGNVVFGGLIGAGVDAATGAAYDYPTLLQIMMGDPIAVPNAAMAPQVSLAPAMYPTPVAQAGRQ